MENQTLISDSFSRLSERSRLNPEGFSLPFTRTSKDLALIKRSDKEERTWLKVLRRKNWRIFLANDSHYYRDVCRLPCPLMEQYPDDSGKRARALPSESHHPSSWEQRSSEVFYTSDLIKIVPFLIYEFEFRFAQNWVILFVILLHCSVCD